MSLALREITEEQRQYKAKILRRFQKASLELVLHPEARKERLVFAARSIAHGHTVSAIEIRKTGRDRGIINRREPSVALGEYENRFKIDPRFE